MENITKMLDAAKSSRPADFKTHFNAEVNSRVVDYINDVRSDVVGNMIATRVVVDDGLLK